MVDNHIKQLLHARKHPPNSRVFVGNLNPETTDDELRLNFERFGVIRGVDRRSDFMLVEYEKEESAEKAIGEMDQIVIDDYPLRVLPAWLHHPRQAPSSLLPAVLSQLVEKFIY